MGQKSVVTSGVVPARADALIGRDDDITAVAAAVQRSRLVTLIGPGGVGKTSLAAAVARHPALGFEACRWVDLAATAAGTLVIDAVARATAAPPASDIAAGLRAHLGDRRVLLVLDNCEHVIDDAAAVVADVIRDCPRTHFLATSRIVLDFPGETVWPVAPLPTNTVADEDTATAPAVELFLRRATAARPDLLVDEVTRNAAAGICRRVEGLPLAIELAASWCQLLTPVEIEEQLRHGLGMLRHAERGRVQRQRSLEESLSWSWELLSPGDQQALASLSVLPAAFFATAAAATTHQSMLDTYDMLRRLVAASLLAVDRRPTRSRYRMLATVREFARERLPEKAATAALDGMLDWALEASRAAAGSDQQRVAELLSDDLDAYRAALTHAAEAGRWQDGLALAVRLQPLFETRHTAEGLQWCLRLLEQAGEKPPLNAALTAAALATLTGDFSEARRWADTSRDAAGHPELASSWHRIAGRLDRWNADLDRALEHFGRAATAAQAVGEDRGLVDAWCATSDILMWNDQDAARELTHRAVALARRAGDRLSLERALIYSGAAAQWRTELAEAEEQLAEGIALGQSLGEQVFLQLGRSWLARVASHRGDYDTALQLVADVQRQALATGSFFGLAAASWAGTLATWESGRQLDGVEAERWAATVGSLGYPALAAEIYGAVADSAVAAGNPEAARRAVASLDEQAATTVGACVRGRGRLAAAVVASNDDRASAAALLGEAIGQMNAARDRLGTIRGVELFASLARVRSPALALRLIAAASAERQRLGCPLPQPLAGLFTDTTSKATKALGDTDAERVLVDASSMSMDSAVALCRRRRSPRAFAPVTGMGSLTPTERDVVELIAAGHSNAQIATELFMSEPTVKTHVRHVFDKLGVRSRAAVAAVVAVDDGRHC